MEDKLKYQVPALMEMFIPPVVQGGPSRDGELTRDEDGNDGRNTEDGF